MRSLQRLAWAQMLTWLCLWLSACHPRCAAIPRQQPSLEPAQLQQLAVMG